MPRLRHDEWRSPKIPKPPEVGDIVEPWDRPAGFPLWRVIDVPPAAGPSDIVTLEAVDPSSPMKQTRRRISSLRLDLPTQASKEN